MSLKCSLLDLACGLGSSKGFSEDHRLSSSRSAENSSHFNSIIHLGYNLTLQENWAFFFCFCLFFTADIGQRGCLEHELGWPRRFRLI